MTWTHTHRERHRDRETYTCSKKLPSQSKELTLVNYSFNTNLFQNWELLDNYQLKYIQDKTFFYKYIYWRCNFLNVRKHDHTLPDDSNGQMSGSYLDGNFRCGSFHPAEVSDPCHVLKTQQAQLHDFTSSVRSNLFGPLEIDEQGCEHLLCKCKFDRSSFHVCKWGPAGQCFESRGELRWTQVYLWCFLVLLISCRGLNGDTSRERESTASYKDSPVSLIRTEKVSVLVSQVWQEGPLISGPILRRSHWVRRITKLPSSIVILAMYDRM